MVITFLFIIYSAYVNLLELKSYKNVVYVYIKINQD